MKLRIVTLDLDIYKVNEHGYIHGGPNKIETPSGQWIFLGLDHVKRTTHTISREVLIDMLEVGPIYRDWWLFKNGSPQWRVRDYDHGTLRLWGQGIREISEDKS